MIAAGVLAVQYDIGSSQVQYRTQLGQRRHHPFGKVVDGLAQPGLMMGCILNQPLGEVAGQVGMMSEEEFVRCVALKGLGLRRLSLVMMKLLLLEHVVVM